MKLHLRLESSHFKKTIFGYTIDLLFKYCYSLLLVKNTLAKENDSLPVE